MKKIIIHAYTQLNLGDDLFIKILVDRYPKTEFILYAPKVYKKVLKDYPNIMIINSDSLIKKTINFFGRFFGFYNLCRFLLSRKCDGSILIGGSVFIQNRNWLIEYRNKKEMIIEKKPFFILGSNFGPYSNQNFLIKYKNLFERATDICFRDTYSYNLFSNLPNTRYAPDIVFTYQNKILKQKRNNRLILISVIKPSIRADFQDLDKTYFTKIKDLCSSFVEKNYEVYLISFCKYEEDHLAIQDIMDLLPNKVKKVVKVHNYEGRMNVTLDLFSKARYVIASRFHSMILGWIYKCSVFPIIYSDKMTHILEDMDFKGDFTHLDNLESLKVEKVLGALENNEIKIDCESALAEKHFKNLDTFLKS